MVDWQSLTLAMYDAIGVLVPSLIIAFVLDAFVYAMLDSMGGESDNV
jgi:hypothetical protein